jgi:hypothetical protein
MFARFSELHETGGKDTKFSGVNKAALKEANNGRNEANKREPMISKPFQRTCDEHKRLEEEMEGQEYGRDDIQVIQLANFLSIWLTEVI